HDAIAARVRAQPDATMAELRQWLFDTHGVRASMGLMWNTLDRLELTLKKTLARGRAGPGRCRRGAAAISGAAAQARSGTLGVFGCNRDEDEHDPAAWAGAAGPAVGRLRAVRAFANQHLHR